MNPITQIQIDEEIAQSYKPNAISSGLTILPLNELGDREFEMMVYSLTEARIHQKDYAHFDQVVLMKGVGERGRDCLLYSEGKVAGLIQCKKLQKKISRPEVMEEITKFLMFSISEDDLMPSPATFEYHFYASSGYFEPATTLLSSFNVESKKEVESGKVLSLIQSLKEKYATFKPYDELLALKHVASALDVITVKFFSGVELNLSLTSHPAVMSKFFRTMPVIDAAQFEVILSEQLAASGVKFLTDKNLSDLYKRLSEVPPEFQVALGNADFFGYSESFFKFLGKEGFGELLKKVTDVRLFLDLKAHDFAASLIMPEVLDKLTDPYVKTGRVLPFTLSVVTSYLAKRILPSIMSKASPKALLINLHPQIKLNKSELIDSVLEQCLESSRRFFAGDYSAFPNPDPDRERRIELFEKMHGDCITDIQLKDRFRADLPVIMPVVDEIEVTIKKAVPQVRTIVINDMSHFDDPEKLKRVFTTIGAIE